jgi:3-hydroxyisobutyrate dehydrogenase
VKLAYIGLGNLGEHIAMNLVDAAFTCLPSTKAIEAVFAEIIPAMPQGSTWIDNSTNDYDLVVALGERAEAAGIRAIEAPVTGGVHLARSGEISVILGGSEEVVERHMELFRVIGNRIFHVGVVGQASKIKAITNMLAFIHLVADGEALMLAKKGGLDLKTAWEVIQASSGNSFVHETEGQLVLNGSYQIDFTFDLALKDLGFIDQMSREYDVPVELASLVRQTYIRGRAEYGGDAESPMIVKLLEDACKTDLRAPGFPAHLEP